MTIQEAIKKAIEGGYKYKDFVFEFNADYNIRSSTFLDPLFWQSLGKAMMWDDANYPNTSYIKETKGFAPHHIIYGHEIMWHRFIDHLASGGEIEEFFAKL